jgi:NADPH2:quinone reductase
MRVAGVNFADTLMCRGRYVTPPTFPETPGLEGAGIVDEVGSGLNPALVGRRVAFMGRRTYAEFATAPAAALIPLPDQIDFDMGAAFPVQMLTAYHLLYTMDHVRPGMTVLIHAVAGGMGLQLTQMAKRAGARVFGTTSTEEKANLAREFGADQVIIYTQTDFAERIKELTGGRGVDLVLDSVGKATFVGSLRSLAPFGHLIMYGAASGQPEKLSVIGTLMQKSQTVSAFWLFTTLKTPEVAERGLRQVLDWLVGGQIKVHIGLTLPLERAVEAHRKMEARETTGKIVLTVS